MRGQRPGFRHQREALLMKLEHKRGAEALGLSLSFSRDEAWILYHLRNKQLEVVDHMDYDPANKPSSIARLKGASCQRTTCACPISSSFHTLM
jgi:hypothetical protein